MHPNRPNLAHTVGPGHRLLFDGRLDLGFADDDEGRGLHVETNTRCLDLPQEHRRPLDTGEVVDDALRPGEPGVVDAAHPQPVLGGGGAL